MWFPEFIIPHITQETLAPPAWVLKGRLPGQFGLTSPLNLKARNHNVDQYSTTVLPGAAPLWSQDLCSSTIYHAKMQISSELSRWIDHLGFGLGWGVKRALLRELWKHQVWTISWALSQFARTFGLSVVNTQDSHCIMRGRIIKMNKRLYVPRIFHFRKKRTELFLCSTPLFPLISHTLDCVFFL